MAKKEIKFVKAVSVGVPPRIPSDVFVLDMHLGRGSNGLNGWPIGRMSLIYGDESGGKTTLVLKAIANAQKLCAKCYLPKERCECKGGPKEWSILYVDGERCWTTEWARNLGVDPNNVDLLYPPSVEDMIDIITEEVQNRDIIVIETLAAILASEEMDDTAKVIGLKARLLDQAAQRWLSASNNVTFFVENQLRKNISISSMPFVPPDRMETIPGGKWQKFLATTIVRVYPSRPIIDVPDMEDGGDTQSKDVIAQRFTVEVEKNKVFIKGGKSSFELSTLNDDKNGYKVGDVISNEASVIETAISLGIATKVSDRKIEYKDRSFPYMSAFVKFLKENREAYQTLVDEVITSYEKRHSVCITKTIEGGKDDE